MIVLLQHQMWLQHQFSVGDGGMLILYCVSPTSHTECANCYGCGLQVKGQPDKRGNAISSVQIVMTQSILVHLPSM